MSDYNETRLKVQFTETVFYGRITKKIFEVKNGSFEMDFAERYCN